jgi:hypothetical protein
LKFFFDLRGNLRIGVEKSEQIKVGDLLQTPDVNLTQVARAQYTDFQHILFD